MSKLPVTEEYIQLARGRVWCGVPASSAGFPLVVLHGGTVAASGYFAPLLALAAERPVVLYDHLDASYLYCPEREREAAEAGQPDADQFGLFMADMEEIAARVPFPSGVTEHRLHLMGHSWGTLLALEYALEGTADPGGVILDLVETPPGDHSRNGHGIARRPSITNRLMQLRLSKGLHEVDLPALLIANDQQARYAATQRWFHNLLPDCTFLTLGRSSVARPGEDARFLEAARSLLRRADGGCGLPQPSPKLVYAA